MSDGGSDQERQDVYDLGRSMTTKGIEFEVNVFHKDDGHAHEFLPNCLDALQDPTDKLKCDMAKIIEAGGAHNSSFSGHEDLFKKLTRPYHCDTDHKEVVNICLSNDNKTLLTLCC